MVNEISPALIENNAMATCCEDKTCAMGAMRRSHGRLLWAMLAINATMFVVESGAGIRAHSTALLADALDMLGDALVYGFSLFVLRRSARWQAGAALVKGGFMLAFGLGVLWEAFYRAVDPTMPSVDTVGIIGGAALGANLICCFLLYRYRSDNLNLSSTWLCSRNDLMANIAVLLAAYASHRLVSPWPDIGVGTLIASLFLFSAAQVLRQATVELSSPPAPGLAARERAVE